MRGLLECLSRTIVKIFFREIIVEGKENLDESSPILFTPNHPNALLDPLLIQFFSQEFNVRFVAKAPLFKIPVFGSILRSLGAIPVMRRMDASNTEVDYTQFFSACVDALAKGDSIAIFPEGRSLPQPFLAPMRTGPARLFFLARERSISVRIVPVGLNYESGSLFRSAVQISIAPPINTVPFEEQHPQDPVTVVKNLTEEIGRILDKYVFQAETYRDRELILLLDRLYSGVGNSSWADRLDRLRQFESAIDDLRNTHSREIDRLRHLLARYQRLSTTFEVDSTNTRATKQSIRLFLASSAGLILAGAGWLLNVVPYKFTDFLVRITRKDESEAGTFKVVFGLFLFPATYALEVWLINRWLGWIPALLFIVLIVPLTLFTMHFFEWREEIGASPAGVSLGFGWTTAARASVQLERLKNRIVSEVDTLADEWQKLSTTSLR